MANFIESKSWRKFVKFLNYGSRVLSALVAAASLALGIYSAVATNNADLIGLDWWIVITIIVFNSIFLIGAAIYECVLFVVGKNVKNERDELAKELDDREQKIKLNKEYIGTLLDYSSYVNAEYVKEYNKIDEIYHAFQDYAEQKNVEAVSGQMNLNNPADVEAVVNYVVNFKDGIIKSFNEFIGFVIRELKIIIDAALKQKGLDLNCSISLKQMSDSYQESVDDTNKIKILTCYRDSESFVHQKREVGKKEYDINSNSDFRDCLQHEHFIKNNLTGVNATYLNENGDFLSRYNCTIVVPIFGLYKAGRYYFGYLACDTLNNNLENADIFDDEMVKIMKMTAILLGGYFGEHCNLWYDAINSLNDFIWCNEVNDKTLLKIGLETNFIKMLYAIKLKSVKNPQKTKRRKWRVK